MKTKKAKATYRKLIVDGVVMAVWKGGNPSSIRKFLKLAGIHIEISNKEEFDKKNKKKRKGEMPDQLSLF